MIADLSVQPIDSIKTDTQVTMASQGLTGVSYIEMVGGSPDAPPIWKAMPDPTIMAARTTSVQDLLARANVIVTSAEETAAEVKSLISENSGRVTQAVKDVQTFTGALAQNSDKVADLIDQISSASAGVADATKRLQGIVERSEAVISAVDPAKVRSTLDNVAALTENLAGQRERIDSIVQRADQVAANVESFSQRLPELGAKADALIAAIEPERVGATLDRIDAIAGAIDPAKVGSTLDKVDSVMAAVDPAQVRATIDNVTRTTNTLAARVGGDRHHRRARQHDRGERRGVQPAPAGARREDRRARRRHRPGKGVGDARSDRHAHRRGRPGTRAHDRRGRIGRGREPAGQPREHRCDAGAARHRVERRRGLHGQAAGPGR